MRILIKRSSNGFILASAFFDKRKLVNLVVSNEEEDICFKIHLPAETIALDVVITNEEEHDVAD